MTFFAFGAKCVRPRMPGTLTPDPSPGGRGETWESWEPPESSVGSSNDATAVMPKHAEVRVRKRRRVCRYWLLRWSLMNDPPRSSPTPHYTRKSVHEPY